VKHKPRIVVESRFDEWRFRWCAECHELHMHEWHTKSANHAIVNLLDNLRLHGYSGNREDYEIEIIQS
jgi:hypothetical protein